MIALAREELGVEIDLDTSRLDSVKRGDGIAKYAHVAGSITYPGSAQFGRLIVIKLAVTASTPQESMDARATNRYIPYRSTLRQWLPSHLFDAF